MGRFAVGAPLHFMNFLTPHQSRCPRWGAPPMNPPLPHHLIHWGMGYNSRLCSLHVRETLGFPVFSGGIERDHWNEVGGTLILLTSCDGYEFFLLFLLFICF